jgi:hypothetical protein
VTEEFAGINFCWLDYALTTADGTSYNMNQLLDYDSATREPHFQKPADVSTSSAVPDGYSITGKVVSYNSANEITYSLYPSDGKGGYSETALEGYDGATLIEAKAGCTCHSNGTTAYEHTQEFTITDVPAGTYKLVIMKKNHLNFTVTDIEITGGDVDLTANANSRVQKLQMGMGDIDGDGAVTAFDINEIAGDINFGSSTAGEYDRDADGDGGVNSFDINDIAGKEWFGNSDENYLASLFKVSAKS